MESGSSDEALRFVLELSPDPRHVGTARIFVASLARHFGCGEEAVEDLKLAVSEACSPSIREDDGGGGTSVRIVVVSERGSLRVGVEGEPLAGINLELIRALFPDAKVPEAPDTTSLLLTVPLSA